MVPKRQSLSLYILKLSLFGMGASVTMALALYHYRPTVLYAYYRCLTAPRPWYACYAGKPIEFTAEYYGMQYVGDTGNQIDVHVLYLGAYEKHVLHFLRDTMIASWHKDGIFVDVGANVGQHSLFMSQYAKAVYAFEPYDAVLKRLYRNIVINGITNIIVYPVGLGNVNKKIVFYSPPDANLGMGSFVRDWSESSRLHKELEVVIGDQALEKAGVDCVSIIKIDVEGYENEVLEGLAYTMQKCRPIVVFEVSIDPSKKIGFGNMSDMRQAFPEGYEFRVIQSGDVLYRGIYELKELNEILEFDVISQYNVVAYPVEKAGKIPLTNNSR